MIIEIAEEIESNIKSPPKLWDGSKHKNWDKVNSVRKGAIGTKVYKKYLESLGYEVKIVSNEGDLMYRHPLWTYWIRSEVKASKAELTFTKRGFLTEKLWFNQIRPKQEGWDEVTLVGIYPNHIRIWRKTRKEWDAEFLTMNSTGGLSHIGTDDLKGIELVKNTRRDNFSEWECIHNDQQGDLI